MYNQGSGEQSGGQVVGQSGRWVLGHQNGFEGHSGVRVMETQLDLKNLLGKSRAEHSSPLLPDCVILDHACDLALTLPNMRRSLTVHSGVEARAIQLTGTRHIYYGNMHLSLAVRSSSGDGQSGMGSRHRGKNIVRKSVKNVYVE